MFNHTQALGKEAANAGGTG